MSTHTIFTHDGSMLPTPMPCSIVDSASTSRTSCSAVGVAILRDAQIHDRVGQRAIVADAAGQHVVDVVPDALVHHAGRQHALLDGLPSARRRGRSC